MWHTGDCGVGPMRMEMIHTRAARLPTGSSSLFSNCT